MNTKQETAMNNAVEQSTDNAGKHFDAEQSQAGVNHEKSPTSKRIGVLATHATANQQQS